MSDRPANGIPRLLTIEETADILNESTKTTRRRIKSGELPHVRMGRLIRILPDDLDRFIASRRRTSG
jgi:excisionase family DNA binding protein